jgi:predicted TIM-barrel fold metal-dependent hydrolase
MADTTTVDVNREIEAAERVAAWVVDADQHVNPPPTMWADYLSPEFRALAPTVESDDEFDYVVFEGARRKINLMSSQAGRKFEEYKNAGKLSDQRKGGWLVDNRLDDMDKDGIDVAVIYAPGPLQTADFDLYIDSFGGCNRWLMDFCSNDPKRLHGVCYIPMVDVDQAIKMLREARAMGAVGVNIPAFPQTRKAFTKQNAQAMALTGDTGSELQYRDREFDRFWAAACDLDVAITFHLGGRVSRFADKVNFLPDMPMARVAMLEVAGILCYGGVFDRFPDLRVGLIEAGVGWMPWACAFMDRTWEMQRHWTECKAEHPPSYYWDQNIYGSFIWDPPGVQMRHSPGCKNIMWSSDYPHSETTFPNSQKAIASNFEGVPKADRDWIIGGCAEKFYGLK